MKRDENPWSPRMECYALCPGRLGFKLGQHIRGLHGVSGGSGEAVASTMQLLAIKRREEKAWREKLSRYQYIGICFKGQNISDAELIVCRYNLKFLGFQQRCPMPRKRS